MANGINNFVVNTQHLNEVNSLTYLLNTDDSDELNIIRHSPYFIDDDLLQSSTFHNKMYARRTRSFSVTRMRSSNSARMNKFDFTTEKIGSVHMTVFEIVASRNVDN